VGVGFLLFGRQYLALYGPAFLDGYPALAVLVTMWCLCAACGFGLVLVNMTGNEWVGVFAMIIGMCGNIFLNYLLIPRLGLLGAAIATTFQFTVPPLILVWFCWSRLNVRIAIWTASLPLVCHHV
jgi:O-antigen/teichoic acid export membrane protein